MSSKRKSITTRTRFEIFKRDNFTCAYCGQKPPNVVLEVDHIVPICAGGDNGNDNLVSSCYECNRGKAGISLSSIPESMMDKANRIKEAEKQLLAYRKIINKQRERLDDDCWAVLRQLFGETTNEVNKRDYASVKMFIERLSYEECMEAAEIAWAKQRYDRKIFMYFCGICWRKIKEQ